MCICVRLRVDYIYIYIYIYVCVVINWKSGQKFEKVIKSESGKDILDEKVMICLTEVKFNTIFYLLVHIFHLMENSPIWF